MRAIFVLRWAKSRQSLFLTKNIRAVNTAGNTGMRITDMSIHARWSNIGYDFKLRYAFLPPGVNSKGKLVPPSPQSQGKFVAVLVLFVHACSYFCLISGSNDSLRIFTLKIVRMQRRCGGWKITIDLFRVLKRALQTV